MTGARWPLLPAALPVLVVGALHPAGYAPFGPTKWLAVTTVAPLACAAALRTNRSSTDRRVGVAWAAVLAWMLVCALAGVDRWYALTGTPERHAGVWFWALSALAFVTGRLHQRGPVPVSHRGPARSPAGSRCRPSGRLR